MSYFFGNAIILCPESIYLFFRPVQCLVTDLILFNYTAVRNGLLKYCVLRVIIHHYNIKIPLAVVIEEYLCLFKIHNNVLVCLLTKLLTNVYD